MQCRKVLEMQMIADSILSNIVRGSEREREVILVGLVGMCCVGRIDVFLQ